VARLLSAVARACPSTAFIGSTCLAGKRFAVRYHSESARAEVFADPDALLCGSGSPNGRGAVETDGIRISGSWPNASGCEDATWAGLALMLDGELSRALVPTADLTIERTWNAAGMRGTGSHSLVAHDVLVPRHRVSALTPPVGADFVLYAVSVFASVVGAARGALDVMAAMFASGRKPHMTAYARMGDSPGARQWLAEATHLVGRAERTMIDLARGADAVAPQGAEPARIRVELGYAVRDCLTALDRMLDLHGTSGFAGSNALQRFWRDAAVAARHPQLRLYLALEDYGRALTP
jgi:alkylation response protein AidB-like acyl-CoA dehydrogenase